MARRAKADNEAEAVQPEEVRQAISARKLKSLLSSARKAKEGISEIAGGFGSEVKDAVENHHLHRKAFRVIESADRMEPEKLADFFDCLDHYRDISGLNDRAASVQRLDLNEPEEEETPNVKRFPAPRGVAAE